MQRHWGFHEVFFERPAAVAEHSEPFLKSPETESSRGEESSEIYFCW